MDKVQEIRQEVENLKSQLLRGACSSQIAMETRCKEEAYNEVLAILDTMQEEPVNRTPADVESAMQEVKEKSRVFTEAHKGEDTDTILAQMRGEEPVSKDYRERYKRITQSEQFKKSYEGMSVGEVMPIEGEEPVSEDLEEASKEWLRPQLDKSYDNYGEAKMMELTHFDGYAMLDAIEFGAKWQEQKDSIVSEDLGDYINELSKQFPEMSFAKLSRIAVRVAKWQKQKDDGEIKMVRELLADFDKHCDEYHEAGFKHGQEALMKDATETTVHIGAGNYPYIPQIELYDYDKDVPLAKEGDKYKVVLIKKD